MTDNDKSRNMLGSVMVIGGGVAGIQASLDLADSGYYVYMVENQPSIGGAMAQLDKTFPTNDCAMCILSPKLVEVGRHLNIELLTLTELQEVEGGPGDFKVKVRKKARYVDLDKCTACGDCTKVCPVSLPREYDQDLSERKAIYKHYAQAIPSGYVIDKRDKSPCTNACPNNVNAHGYVALVSQGKYKEALEVIMRTLPLPGVIGRVCPHPCEEACRRGQVDAPVSICAIKRFVADQVDVEDLPMPEITKRDEKVAIIGSGPAGLTAAYFLALDGYQVTIFEALPVAGGMLRVGIPDYRLPPEVLDKEIRAITRLGVEIKFNTALGRDVTVDGLFADGYKAVYLGIGAHGSLKLNIQGEDAEGVMTGVEFLRKVNLGELKDLKSARVAIVGGGDVAIDAARSARRMGVENVSILYRRSREEMPARANEVNDALAEGVEIKFLTAPQQVVVKDGKAAGVQCIRMELGEPDASGRRRPVPVEGSEFTVDADIIIPAIGQTPESKLLSDVTGVSLTKWGTIEVDELTLATGREGVFAGGDAQTGPWIAIGAVAHGKEAAISISRFLKGEDMKTGRERVSLPQENFTPIPPGTKPTEREEMAALAVGDRVGDFREVEQGLTEEQAKAEAARCLNCMACCECEQCVSACKVGAISHLMKDENITLNVGSIIAAPGFKAFDPKLYDYGYGKLPNVVTSLEFERILSATGPFQGHLLRPSDHAEPKKIAWLQCVGSRDTHHCSNGYCSSVCCMYAIKEAVIAMEHSKIPLETSIFFMDMRTTGKDFEKFYNRSKDEYGVKFVRSRVHSVEAVPASDDLLLRHFSSEDGQLREEKFDMVVLSVGLETPPETVDLAKRLGIELNEGRFAVTSPFEPVSATRPGVFVCGSFQGPKDIPLSVMEASAAASEAAVLLAPARGTLARKPEVIAERDVAGEEPRIGVFVCHCGINIGSVVDVPAVKEYARTLPNVAYVDENLFTCSQDTQEKMKEAIHEHKLNRLIVASCSPRTHEPLFQQTIKEAGLNRFLFEMANIRDQGSWVHQNEPEAATEKAKDLVRMAVAKSALQQPLAEFKVNVTKSALVIGGGIAGMEAAMALANQNYPVTLVEKKGALGGHGRKLLSSWEGQPVAPYLDDLVRRVESHPLVTVRLNSEVKEVSGFVGNFRTMLDGEGGRYEVNHGVAVVAVGAHSYKPKEHLYGQSDRVFLNLDLDLALRDGNEMVKQAKSAVFIQCVGSRIPERPYCSKVCCTHSVENALRLKKMNPDMDVYILYRDMRTFGMREYLYKEAREKGVIFVRFDVDRQPQTELIDGKIQVTVIDHILQRPIVLNPDVLTLASAIVMEDPEELAKLFKIPVNPEGFFLEAHVKLRPVDFATDGVYVAGLAHYPKSTDECIAQAKAAAARAATVLAKDSITAGGVVASINKDFCSGCQACLNCCPFNAISYLEQEGCCEVNQALCKGCGTCAAACPSEAITLLGFSHMQLYAQIDEALSA